MVDPVELRSLVHRIHVLFERTVSELRTIRADAEDAGLDPDAVTDTASAAFDAPATPEELVEAYRRARGG